MCAFVGWNEKSKPYQISIEQQLLPFKPGNSGCCENWELNEAKCGGKNSDGAWLARAAAAAAAAAEALLARDVGGGGTSFKTGRKPQLLEKKGEEKN